MNLTIKTFKSMRILHTPIRYQLRAGSQLVFKKQTKKPRFPRRFLAPGLFGRFRETSFLPGLPVRFGTAKITIIYGQISSDLCQRLNGLIVWQTNRHTPTKRSDAQPLVEREKQFECLPELKR